MTIIKINEDENEYRINYNQRAYWMVQVTNRWLSLRLEILGTFITFASAIFAVVAKDTISPCTHFLFLFFLKKKMEILTFKFFINFIS